ncbi:hypothetical protein UCRPC4_g05983 [Phaeomoniella chlamydospora]|uniref:Uncharacterized protein n=1 Tax=Phaeomoniella chlamydospora TaxID=158046 RepID=A0A0G2GGV6_PHACM|nr:hypothetical protein UCRPC4_g05983 [Phaeomoniella chlamydospora]
MKTCGGGNGTESDSRSDIRLFHQRTKVKEDVRLIRHVLNVGPLEYLVTDYAKGRRCDGYEARPPPKLDVTNKLGNERERRAHFFFREFAVPEMGNPLEEGLWLSILRISETNKAVFHMTNAVGSAYESQRTSSIDKLDPLMTLDFARGQCNKAIQLMLLQEHRACQTVISIGALLGWQWNNLTDKGRATIHLASGLRLAMEIAYPKKDNRNNSMTTMDRSYARDRLVPYLLHASGNLSGGLDPVYSFREALKGSIDRASKQRLSVPSHFASVDNLTESLQNVYRYAVGSLVPAETRSGYRLPTRNRALFEKYCEEWRSGADGLLNQSLQSSVRGRKLTYSIATTAAWERQMYICITSLNDISEMSYDKYRLHFKAILTYAQQGITAQEGPTLRDRLQPKFGFTVFKKLVTQIDHQPRFIHVCQPVDRRLRNVPIPVMGILAPAKDNALKRDMAREGRDESKGNTYYHQEGQFKRIENYIQLFGANKEIE